MSKTLHIVLVMKPLEGNFAQNVLEYNTGGLNIDACRVGTSKDVPASPSRTKGIALCGSVDGSLRHETGQEEGHNPNIGRFPANVILEDSKEVMGLFPTTTSGSKDMMQDGWGKNGIYSRGKLHRKVCVGDSGSASRFFKSFKEE